MIQRLELHRWRAFDHVAIDFQAGTTFLVAPNGVGKTSLLLGLTWGLFGDASKVDAKTCIRLGCETAEAIVTLTIRDERQLVVHRTVALTGKATVEYHHGERRIEDAEAHKLLTDEFGAPIEIASRLAVIRGSGQGDGELQLREHLYDAFGVTGLRRAAATATKLNKDAVAARKKLRTASRSQLANRDQLTLQADKLRDDVADLAVRREPLADAVAEAVRSQQTLATWSAYDSALLAHTQAVADLLGDARDHGLEATDPRDLTRVLAAATDSILSAVGEAQKAADEARAQALAATAALELLEGHDPSCPTCARPFHGDELSRAVAAQHGSLTLAQSRIDGASREIERLADEQAQLNALRSRLENVLEPPVEPSLPRPTGDPVAALAIAQEAVREHDQLAGGVAAELEAIAGQLEDDDALQAAYAAERAAWRREAISQAAVAALRGTAERLATEYIEPLSQQVRWRWKALFGDDGLQLRPDGTIVRVVGDRELPWSQLSGGEQIWARLVASLLVLRASTTLSFAWLDEPLEHLDPRARRIVATDLAAATESGRPAQLIVTTYEHTLARQLAEDVPGTHLRQINHAEQFDPPPRRRADLSDSEGESGSEGEASTSAA